VKLALASAAVPGWNEIDAVGILDSQGKVHWAKAATGSSSYGAPMAAWNTQRNNFVQVHRSTNCLSCHSNAHQSGASLNTWNRVVPHQKRADEQASLKSQLERYQLRMEELQKAVDEMSRERADLLREIHKD